MAAPLRIEYAHVMDIPRLPVRAARRQVASRGNARQAIVSDSAWIEGRRRDAMGRPVAAALARRLCAVPGREIAARLGYRNVSSACGACPCVRCALKDRGFSKDLARPPELLYPNH